MPSSRVLRTILLVSCAHALVHLLEQSIASVEQVISNDFGLSLTESGWLGTALRLPYGFGAFASGLLADRFGEKRILVLYLIGSAVVSVSFIASTSAAMVYAQLFGIGVFASMYHPAGLALLANETTPQQRARALGTHGVFGSLGIASAPFLAGLVLSIRPNDWKSYYAGLGVISALLAAAVWLRLRPASDASRSTDDAPAELKHPTPPAAVIRPLTLFQKGPYTALVIGAALSGVVYGGVLHFLPRYLEESGCFNRLEELIGRPIPHSALGNYAAALALVCGAFGQWVAGRIAKPRTLPTLLSIVYAANIPLLLWMTVAVGTDRLWAACLWAFVHFMNQPLYNSLLPEFVPIHRRSAGFGFSNMMGFGIGAAGPPFVAMFHESFTDYTYGYSALAVLALFAAMLPLLLVSKRFADRTVER